MSFLLLLIACPVPADAGMVSTCDDPRYSFADNDGDGFGDPATANIACGGDVTGFVAATGDCDDADGTVFPGALETCNQVDDDCDGSIDLVASDASIWYVDGDGDGYGAGEPIESCEQPAATVDNADDPNDDNASAYPGAPERCDGLDNDGDGEVDESGAEGESTFYADQDGDGYGAEAEPVAACTAPLGYTEAAGDCDDARNDIYPGASEPDCTDPVDYNCDGTVGYRDGDGDGFAACAECDDTTGAVNPSAPEGCNDIDDDCDGTVDNAAADALTWFLDADSDGFGSSFSVQSCKQPAGYTSIGGDCDDASAAAFPGEAETCDGVDNDCDGNIDTNPLDGTAYYADTDRDGYGDPEDIRVECAIPEGYLLVAGDCDDADPWANPEGIEVCDGLDDNCNGEVDESGVFGGDPWYRDADGDEFGDPATTIIACLLPAGYVANTADCDDTNADIHPNATESCNSIDEDCDGTADDGPPADAPFWYLDYDGDGFGGSTTRAACEVPPGYVATFSDCNDADVSTFPGATEVCDGMQNDCDSAWTTDAGTASFQATDGTWADWTAALASGTPSLLAEIDLTENGTLNICAGTWYANIEAANSRSIEVVGPDGAAATVLDGAGLGRVLSFGSYGTYLLRGFTVQNGSATYGGAAYIDAGSTTQIDDCTFRDNSATYGGAITGYFLHASIAIRHSIFENNAADYGGALDGGSYGGGHSAFFISDSTFVGNEAYRGGALYMLYPTNSVEVRDAELYDNSASSKGGAMVLDGVVASVTRSNLYGNMGGEGGAVHVRNGASATFDHSTIHDNSATSWGGGILGDAFYAELYNNIVLNETPVYDNTSANVGGGVALSWSNLRCLGSNEAGGGVYGNTASSGGAEIWFYGVNYTGNNTIVGNLCDIGDPRDGTSGDITVDGLPNFSFGTDATFSCDPSGC